MKLEIYDDTKAEEKPPVRLRLKNCDHGIEVVAVDNTGNTIIAGHLLRFNTSGAVYYMHLGVNDILGFDLGGGGRIKTR